MSNIVTRNRNFIYKLVSAAVVGAVLVTYSQWATAAAASDDAVRQQMAAAERSGDERGPYATDGTFTGSAQGYGGTITSEVVIEDGYIVSVTVLDHSGETDAYYSQAAGLVDKIVEAQSTGVDTVSGATFSSAGILNGVTAALQQSNAGAQGGE